MFSLEVTVYRRQVFKVIAVLQSLTFNCSNHVRRGRFDEFLFEGDEATLGKALQRLEAVPEAICVLQTIVDDSPGNFEPSPSEAVLKAQQLTPTDDAQAFGFQRALAYSLQRLLADEHK